MAAYSRRARKSLEYVCAVSLLVMARSECRTLERWSSTRCSAEITSEFICDQPLLYFIFPFCIFRCLFWVSCTVADPLVERGRDMELRETQANTETHDSHDPPCTFHVYSHSGNGNENGDDEHFATTSIDDALEVFTALVAANIIRATLAVRVHFRDGVICTRTIRTFMPILPDFPPGSISVQFEHSLSEHSLPDMSHTIDQ